MAEFISSIEAFTKFKLKLNRLDTEDNIDISVGEFVLLFNEQQYKWLKGRIRNKSTRYIDDIQNFIKTTTLQKSSNRSEDFVILRLPDDYFDYISSESLVESETYQLKKIISNFEIKVSNVNEYLQDEFNSPSFEYEETFLTIEDNHLKVYYKDFNILSVNLTYYKQPDKIDIEGYIDANGNNSITVNPEMSVEFVDEIIDMCVTEANRIYENGDGYTLSFQREQLNRIKH